MLFKLLLCTRCHSHQSPRNKEAKHYWSCTSENRSSSRRKDGLGREAERRPKKKKTKQKKKVTQIHPKRQANHDRSHTKLVEMTHRDVGVLRQHTCTQTLRIFVRLGWCCVLLLTFPLLDFFVCFVSVHGALGSSFGQGIFFFFFASFGLHQQASLWFVLCPLRLCHKTWSV